MGAPEPMSFTKRRIGFDGPPTKETMTINHIPVLVGDYSVLVADPANVPELKKSHISEHEGIGLVGAEFFDVTSKIINVARNARAIEPPLYKVAIALNQFVHLRHRDNVTILAQDFT